MSRGKPPLSSANCVHTQIPARTCQELPQLAGWPGAQGSCSRDKQSYLQREGKQPVKQASRSFFS